ncbi:uroporphyrinogen-III synthase [Rhodohalobacter sp. SW132]|uniref:uroporphyrinogen-III synthase n=1 Tax=Rhodohalobacter sp. SW132 TaxID=2293433 RepID=UPI000E223C3C|nr:uroporphyrinogen-III synthase [Rhodohalobacter sp. SW132]REL29184.1 uroporphyrinogen-III synthase [Rhodohalobacter sp. SW132]
MTSDKPLSGLNAVCFESRLSESAANLLEKYGANVISAPSMQEVPLEKHDEVFGFGKKLFNGEIDILICTTGVGTQMLINALETRYELEKILDALRSVTIVVRGPKPIRVLKKYKVSFEVTVPAPNTWKEILESMDNDEQTSSLTEKTVAVQEYGESNDDLLRELKQRGAVVLPVRVYRWELPDDTKPLMKGIQAVLDGNVAMALFTSKTQIDHVMQVASEKGMESPLKEAMNNLFVASIGPVCTGGLHSYGIKVDFEPTRSKLGVFVREISHEFEDPSSQL